VENPIYASATAVAQAIRRKEVSSLEVVQAYLDRIEAVNPKLNAVVQLAAASAMEAARASDAALARGDAPGPLHGVPMTIKDSYDTAGVISTAGTLGRVRHVPKRDATVVSRLRSAGAILLGKTNTPELTMSVVTDNYVYGRTNNLYDLARSPGGSSGGAAAIVAAGGSAFDMGSDTGGSIRIPAHCCGIAGLKPTAGRVPRTGHTPFLQFGAIQAFTQVGPLARSVDDLALILTVIAGEDWHDPIVVPMPLADPKSVNAKGLRVAFFWDNELTPTSTDTVNVVRSAALALADLGAEILEDRPATMEAADKLWTQLFGADGGAAVRRMLQAVGTTQMHPQLRWTQEREPLPVSEYIAVLDEWNRLRSNCLAFMERYDAILCPVSAEPAPPHGQYFDYEYTELFNLLGWPVVVVRCGGTAGGLPIGVQVVARPWREEVALALAGRLEKTFGGWQRPPL
jgi:amidase